MLSDATIEYGEAFTTALLGLDALYAAEQLQSGSDPEHDIERLVVLNMSTTHQPESFGSYVDAIVRFGELQRLADTLPEADRRRYYDQASGSAIAFAHWRSGGLPFEDQISRFLHVPAAPASEQELDAIRRELREILNDLGYSGDLQAQSLQWEERQRVPPDEAADTLESYLDEAWNLTEAFMEIPSEKSDGMRVATVSDVPFNAQCDFIRRTIRLNIDPILTRPALRHLAVHEGYPGHYVQFKRREVSYVRGESPADGLLSVVNTASSSPFEGIADYGLHLLGWDTDLDGRFAALMARYRSGIGTRAAWLWHAENQPETAVRNYLHGASLVGGEGWVENRMKFIARHDRSALIWSYWQGEPYVAAAWKPVHLTPKRIPDYVAFVYDRMHSVDTLSMFS